MATGLLCQRTHKLAGKSAEAPPIRQTTAINADFHEPPLVRLFRGLDVAGYFVRARQLEIRLAHRAIAGLGIEAVPRSVRVPGVVGLGPSSRALVYQ